MTDETQPTTPLPRSMESPADITGISMEETRENPIVGAVPKRYRAADISSYEMEQIREGAPPRQPKPRRAYVTSLDPAFLAVLVGLFLLEVGQLLWLLYGDK